MTSISKLINIRRNCNKGEAHACDCVLQVCVRKLSTNWDFAQTCTFNYFFVSIRRWRHSGLSTNRAIYESRCRQIGMSTNRALCESTCNRWKQPVGISVTVMALIVFIALPCITLFFLLMNGLMAQCVLFMFDDSIWQ